MKHIIALSGGKDSTALAIWLNQFEPRDYEYVCTPTGNELPEMFMHWVKLGEILGKPLKPIMHSKGLIGTIKDQGALPNFRMRYCTRILKIIPYREYLRSIAPAVSYVGLRADENDRLGGVYDDIPGIVSRFPFKEIGWDETHVWDYLNQHSVEIPTRTDCAICYHQRLIEWYELYVNHPILWIQGELLESEMKATFRTPGRDTWPVSMKGLRERFERGEIPKDTRRYRDRQQSGSCRVCSL